MFRSLFDWFGLLKVRIRAFARGPLALPNGNDIVGGGTQTKQDDRRDGEVKKFDGHFISPKQVVTIFKRRNLILNLLELR